MAGEVADLLEGGVFTGDEVAVDLEVEVVGAKDLTELLEGGDGSGGIAGAEGAVEGAGGVACEGGETLGVAGEVGPGDAAVAFGGGQMGAGE